MNQNILTDYLKFLNDQIALHEKLMDYHQEAEAMIQVFLASEINTKVGVTLYHYVSILGDIIRRANDLNGEFLDLFLKVRAATLREPPKGGTGPLTVH